MPNKTADKEIIGGWEKFAKEYKPRELTPEEKTALEKTRFEAKLAKRAPFCLCPKWPLNCKGTTDGKCPSF